MAPDRPVDSYEALTAAPFLVDKGGYGRDAGPMQLAALLAVSLFGFLLIGGIILLVVITVAAIWKMRSDDFWDEPPG